MESAEVKKRLENAIHLLYTKDKWLLQVDANERSITFRLGMYLQELFEDWHVDCEYNRDGHDAKTIPSHLWKSDDKECIVYPDIIIHKRGGEGPNLLVIEAKKAGKSGTERDLKKLQSYKQYLKYAYAAFIVIETGEGFVAPKICWSLERPDSK